MDGSQETIWIGRALVDGRPLSFRVTTDGRAPVPTDKVSPVVDPFVNPDEDPWDRATGILLADDGLPATLAELELAAPVRPRKVIGVGRNYRAHAEELGNEVPQSPLLFFKAPTCLIPSGAAIPRPEGYERVDMEAELVAVIGRRASKVPASEAWNHIAGYALGNDVSNRDLQKADKQWTRAKGFDGFGPVGPFIRMVAPGTVLPVDDLRIQGYLNDELKQDGPLSAMIFDLPTLIEHISACMTLEPGDLIYSGTPAGVSPLAPGDVCRVELQGMDLGRLTNPVIRA